MQTVNGAWSEQPPDCAAADLCTIHTLQGDNMFSLFGTKLLSSASHYMFLAAALMIPTVWLPNLSSLSFLGFFGVCATGTVVASVRRGTGAGAGAGAAAGSAERTDACLGGS